MLLAFPWLCIFFLVVSFVGSFLDLRGLVLFVSHLPYGHHFGFHFFSFVGGLRGAEPLSLLWGHSFFIGSLLQRRKYILISLALHRQQVEKGHTFLF